MNANDHIHSAQMRLKDPGFDHVRGHRVEESTAHSRIALALAVQALADAAASSNAPAGAEQEWPEGVTARFLTRTGIRLNNQAATVDIRDDEKTATHPRSTALCRPCGWTKDHGLAYRGDVLRMAQEHANECTALPQPTA
ncbi:hypothetical protein [Streptomyces africanus]|uniref:hypothetical protein n=1 Tax=Streptomyces africanus TaxID=231024 RepID=UPI000A35EF42|nr:hypothetical protein [Streptomyces africanus]